MKEIKLYNTEEFTIEKLKNDSGEKVVLKGNAMPLNETSRNGVYYRPESVKKAYKSLEGVPFLFAHQQNEVRHVLGKVEKVGISDTHVTYEADIDSEEKEFIRKSEKGYIKHVSVGAIINPETVNFNEEKGIAEVDIIEFAELSSAPVPGFKNTDAKLGKQNLILLAESLGKEDIVKKLKETKEDNPEEEEKEEPKEEESKETQEQPEEEPKEEEEEEKPEEDKKESLDDLDEEEDELEIDTVEKKTEEAEEPEEKTEEEKLSEVNSKLEELFSKQDELVNRMSALESKVDTLLDEEEEEKPEEDEEEDEKKKDDSEDEDEKDKDEDEEKEISPDQSETFKNEKPIPQQDEKNKEKTLELDKNLLEAVDIEKQIKKNRQY
jgi:hypothetical protein